MTDRDHWDAIYARSGPDRVSWHQDAPRASLELIDRLGLPPGEAIVDVGGGAAPLAGELLSRGRSDVSVLDLSSVALDESRARLGPAGERVRWIRADVRAWAPDRPYGLWHDRALFHFLVDPADRERYVGVARSALRPGGHAIVATFASDGPARCSGLPVARYDPEDLAVAFGSGFDLVGDLRETHLTPGGAEQPFAWAVLRARVR